MSINDVRPPPNPFPKDHATIELPAGTILHHGHNKKYALDAFNTSMAEFRFSPMFHRGDPIPSWYGGATMACAFYETIFHNAAAMGKDRFISWRYLQERVYGTCRTIRPLLLASFYPPDVARYGITIDQLTATDPMYYAQTARWADAVYDTNPNIDGIAWTSFRSRGEDAYVLFSPPRVHAMLEPDVSSVSVIEDKASVDLINQCMDELKVDLSEHPDATPGDPILRVPSLLMGKPIKAISRTKKPLRPKATIPKVKRHK